MLKFLILLAVLSVCYSAVLKTRSKQSVSTGFLSNIALKSSKFITKKSAKNDEQCNDYQFSRCTNNLAKSLNMTEIPDSGIQFMIALDTIVISQGKSGFEEVCKDVNDYITCLGNTFDSCLSVDHLMSIGLDDEDATVYATLAQQLRYTCGPAYQTFLNHFDCMLADLKHKTFELVYCIEKFTNSVAADPTKICQTAQTFMDCYVSVFSDCGADMTMALCQSMKVGFSVNMPECTDFTCDANSRMGKKFLEKASKLLTKNK